jgi:hypothetical protein
MLPVLAVTLGLLVQGNQLPVRNTSRPEPVRLWRTDSTLYVTLHQPGHLLLMHVDAIGRIDVLFPLVPDDGTGMPGDTTLAFDLSPIAEGNPATFVAVRSRWPFSFSVLRTGSDWDYDALLLQPTAGDPLAAMLDIADRVTDGRPYDYGVAAYSREGLVVARNGPIQPDVCLGCVRRGETVAAAPAALATNSVDCSNTSLTNSFCGVSSGSVSITGGPPTPVQAAAQAVPATTYFYTPYYPVGINRARELLNFRPPPTPAPRASMGVAYPIAPRLVVPSSAGLRMVTRPR